MARRLDRRLTALAEDDRATLTLIEDVLSWRAYDIGQSDADAIRRARGALGQVTQPTLRAIVQQRLELRTAMSAIRRRGRGDGPPAEPWGFGRWTRRIAANWDDPTFRLGTGFTWLREAVTLLDKQDTLGLERHILDVTFRQLQRHGAAHLFDFEAVVIYVLKWDIFDRWARSDARAATHRFEDLVQSALGDFAEPALKGMT